ncbi:MAG: 30S ribosomal protein S16 [Thiotrichales bacterium]|jgi:small subunit ribosomal protein S16|nr:30S ribosomal protein S16 [Thiotrichales bacterium]MBT3613345.1 30S ribosomal protein S16 [Thiotrichales bacterium]MBT3753370.1 30S ribosomal protein S16 [Thiotrichales bacterium]MBT3837519.1 30S ribosomal protein S16 [Thiotrichales bacterium]MBT4152353.1 30S ribosomal protein S16 [Thiotrichales bacterium]
MVVIRLARGGAKKRPFYRIVATDKRNSRDGRFLEKIGYFNPLASGQEKRLEMDSARLDYWVSKGAQLSNRVSGLVKEKSKVPAAAAA